MGDVHPTFHDFCENEVIQFNNGAIYLKIADQVLDHNGDPVVFVERKKSNRPEGRIEISFVLLFLVIVMVR